MSNVVTHFATIIGRLRYLESLDERNGPSYHRSQEQSAINWMLEALEAEYGYEMDQAERAVERREARRRE